MQKENRTNSINRFKPEIQIFAVKVGCLFSELEINQYLFQLPIDEQRRIGKYRNEMDRYRALISAKLLRWGVQTFIGEDKSLQVYRNKYGRPFLDRSLEWEGDFNLSHSGDWAVLAIVNNGRVGIDVERIRVMDKSLLLECLTYEERRVLYIKPEEEWKKLFYEMWSMKEAIFKTGLDPTLSLETIDTSKYILSPAIRDVPLYIKVFHLDNEHPVSVCWENNYFPPQIEVIDKSLIMNTH